jgi:hypothetical protein
VFTEIEFVKCYCPTTPCQRHSAVGEVVPVGAVLNSCCVPSRNKKVYKNVSPATRIMYEETLLIV